MPAISGQPALDVAIGLLFMFFLLSIVCSAVNESIATALGWRAETLLKGLRSMLAEEADPPERPRSQGDLVTAVARTGKAAERQPAETPVEPVLPALLDHPIVRSLVDETARRRIRRQVPSYLPSKTFSLALLDTIAPPAAGTAGSRDVLAEVRSSVIKLENPHLKAALVSILDEARGRVDHFREGVEEWFDATMDRVSGWYTRRVKLRLWLIAFVVAFGLNADSLQVATQLWKDDTLRASVVAQAQQAVREGDTSDVEGAQDAAAQDDPTLSQALEDVRQLTLPLGWSFDPADPRWPDNFAGFLGKVAGLIVTWVALTFGAPFWFDLLGRVGRLRGTGPKVQAATR